MHRCHSFATDSSRLAAPRIDMREFIQHPLNGVLTWTRGPYDALPILHPRGTRFWKLILASRWLAAQAVIASRAPLGAPAGLSA